METNKKEMSASEAIYGFCAWLTGRKTQTIVSSKHDAACIADLIKKFCEVNNLVEPRDNWVDLLKYSEL